MDIHITLYKLKNVFSSQTWSDFKINHKLDLTHILGSREGFIVYHVKEGPVPVLDTRKFSLAFLSENENFSPLHYVCSYDLPHFSQKFFFKD